MTTDFRALCAELVDELNGLSAHVESTTPFETVLSGIRAYNRARAALAHAGLSDLKAAAEQARQALEGWANHGDWVWPESALEQAKRNTTEALTALNAALAEPEPEEPTREEAVAVYSEVMATHECQTLGDMAEHFARAVLARWGQPS